MKMKRLALMLAAGALSAMAGSAMAQQAPKPTPEQLAATYKEDQLSLEQCGVPRNAADDYRPAPMLADQTRAPRVTTTQKFKVETVASGLQNAWAFAFLPDGKMLATIRGGGMRVVGKDGAVSEPLAGTPAIKNAIRLFGMHDVILDRDFKKNRTLYFAYITSPPEGGATQGYVASAKLSADERALTDMKVLKSGDLYPRRIVQANDGTLMIVTADVLPGYRFAQSMQSPNGKVLRINTDGSIPKDNPFAATPDADPSIYALGVRDPQSMAFKPKTNELWIVENEPRGGDELNRIEAGRNYGFPLISYGRDNDGALLNGGKTQQEGLEQPVYFWTPSVAFSGMTFYTGNKLKKWKGSVFAGGLSGMQLVRLEMKNGRVVGEEKLLRDRCKRIRDVRQGPDGYLYVLTDESDGQIWRIRPE
jgi:glucose/arabinose dehydrogenase